MAHLFVLSLEYTAELDQVDNHLAEHRVFLAEQCERGIFLASGRKEPRTGGIILAQGHLKEITHLTEQDPFSKHGVARYSITEFIPTLTCPNLAEFAEQG